MPFQFRKEAIEEDLNSNFPSQGQGNPPLYYSLSEVVVPTYSINSVAEGSGLPQNLQTAWDFSTGHKSIENTSTNLIDNPGFWQVDLTATFETSSSTDLTFRLYLTDGLTVKTIWRCRANQTAANTQIVATDNPIVVYLDTGITLVGQSSSVDVTANVWYRQIASPNGTLVNPLGFSFA